VSIDRSKNYEFENYIQQKEDKNILQFQMNEKIMPPEFAELISSAKDNLTKEGLLNKEDSAIGRMKQLGIEFFKKYGDDYHLKVSNVMGFIESSTKKAANEFVLIQEFEVASDLHIVLQKENFKPKLTHTLRIETPVKRQEGKRIEQTGTSTLTDFDNFMRGNPHPNMPLIL